MSWDGTVRCSECYIKGHNKANCPEKKARYERCKKEDPDSWFVQNYEKEQAHRKKRSCSYCKEEGHTKPTCAHIEADKTKTVEMNKVWRTKTLEHLKNLGLGVGALVQLVQKSSWKEDQTKHVMISEILWENLTFAIQSGATPYAFKARTLNNFSELRYIDFPVDSTGNITQTNDYGLHAEVLGPVSGSSIESNMPTSWLTGEGKEIDDMFLDNRGKPRERCYIDWIKKEE